MAPSVSIIIPALDEEENLEATVRMLTDAAAQRFCDYELLIFDDGSLDRTGEIADELASKDSHIRVIHNSYNQGVGYSFREGVRLATKEFIGWLPADINNLFSPREIERTLDAVGKADFVLMYLSHDNRARLRRITSQGFVSVMNLLLGLRLKYYNGGTFYRSQIIKSAKMDSDGYMLFSSILVRLIKGGHDFVEVGVTNKHVKGGSKAVHAKNFVQVFLGMVRLFWEVRVTRQREREPVDGTQHPPVPNLAETAESDVVGHCQRCGPPS